MTTKADALPGARIDRRFPAEAVPSVTGVRLSNGDVVDLVNISRSGVLIEGHTRFIPGTRATIVFEGTFTPAEIKGRIVRCLVSSIDGGSLRYQSGIEFDRRLDRDPGEQDADDRVPAPPQPAAAVPQTASPVVSHLRNRWY